MEHDEQKDPVAWSMLPTTPTVGLSDRDNKETLFVKEEVTNDAEVFGEVVVDVEGSQKEPLSSILSPPGSSTLPPGSSTALRAPA